MYLYPSDYNNLTTICYNYRFRPLCVSTPSCVNLLSKGLLEIALSLILQSKMDFVSVGRFMLYSLSLFFIYKILAQFKHIKRPPLPPGPKAKFLIGNLGDLPPPGQPEWKHWLQHKDAYGT